jgi:hypothetical protein
LKRKNLEELREHRLIITEKITYTQSNVEESYLVMNEKQVRIQFLNNLADFHEELESYPFLNSMIYISRGGIFSYARDDFCSSDVKYAKTYELGELEATRIEVFKVFGRPVFRKGIVESLKCSSEVQFLIVNFQQFTFVRLFFYTNRTRLFVIPMIQN